MEVEKQLFCVCLFVGSVALIADSLQPFFKRKILMCLIDNIGHAAISAGIWTGSFSRPLSLISNPVPDMALRNRVWEVLMALCAGSLVDVDHFIAAGWSTSLTAATSLPTRPFAHSVLFIFLIVVSSLTFLFLFTISLLISF